MKQTSSAERVDPVGQEFDLEEASGSHLRMRRVPGHGEDPSVRLAAANEALRAQSWGGLEHRRLAEVLRATILELAELEDATTSMRATLAGRPELRRVAQYLARLDAFLRQATDAVLVATFDSADTSKPPDVRDRLAEAIETWEPHVPWEVVFEIAELADGDLHAQVFEASAAWDRAARGLVRRLMIGFGRV